MKPQVFGGEEGHCPKDSVVAVSRICPFPSPGHMSSSRGKQGSKEKLPVSPMQAMLEGPVHKVTT